GAAVAGVGGGGAAIAEHGRVEQRAGRQLAQLRRQVVAAAPVEAVLVHQVLDAEFIDEARRVGGGQAQPVAVRVAAPVPVVRIVLAPGPAVAFVGGDQVGGAAGRVSGDRVGHVQAFHARPGLDGDGAVGIADIQAIAFDAVVLGAQRQDGGNARAGDVELGQRVVFLQGDPGRGAVGRDGDVL